MYSIKKLHQYKNKSLYCTFEIYSPDDGPKWARKYLENS